ncbi:U-box domain-containing protein 21-like [Humulus lupulus]|uniref:U-box domain-containing protein 21-like n=1 Tax=Humulus lupulus TaxID=3486 RepID=UPI002B404619|nr:U-box domain-containing protein 21-like [Humulus lupulus]
MISSWRRRRSGNRRPGKENNIQVDSNIIEMEELTVPGHFRCPISLDLMKDPVTLMTGITYDRQSIETWIEAGNITCPITNQELKNLEPIPNHAIRKMIQGWCVDNRSRGVERIPTPRTPISSHEVLEILSKMNAAIEKRDSSGCRDLAVKIKSSAKESERNKRCFVNNGAGSTLSKAFEAFSSSDDHVVLEEILSSLTLVFPLDDDSKFRFMNSSSSMNCMVRFLESGDLAGRRNSVLLMKQLISSSDHQSIAAVVDIKGALEALVKLIKEPICPTVTKSSLIIIYRMLISSSSQAEKVGEAFVELGLVELLIEMLVEGDRSVCDKALGVLDRLCRSRRGRVAARAHSLTVPVLVKKILRVSDSATEFSVSMLWKLLTMIKNDSNGNNNYDHEDQDDQEKSLIVETLQVGAFQKLLLLLQVGCSERVKEKTGDLLKILNLHRGRLECIETMDFKQIKRSF